MTKIQTDMIDRRDRYTKKCNQNFIIILLPAQGNLKKYFEVNKYFEIEKKSNLGNFGKSCKL